MSDATYVPCPHCGFPYPMSPMQKDLYRGRTLSCNNCAKPFSADELTPVAMPAARAWTPAVARPAPAAAPQPAGKKMSGWTLVALSVGGAALAVVLLVLLLLPPLNRAREQSNRVKCAANMRQIGQAIFIYASVNRGEYPDKLDKLLPYAGSAVFVCPSCGDTPAPGSTPQIQASKLYAGGHLSYVYVGAGMNTNLGTANAATTVVLYEAVANHRDGVNVLYADGSVTFLPRNAALTMIGTLTASTQPATAPAAPTTAPVGQSAPSPGR